MGEYFGVAASNVKIGPDVLILIIFLENLKRSLLIAEAFSIDASHEARDDRPYQLLEVRNDDLGDHGHTDRGADDFVPFGFELLVRTLKYRKLLRQLQVLGIRVQHQQNKADIEILNRKHFQHQRSKLAGQEMMPFKIDDHFEYCKLHNVDDGNGRCDAVNRELFKQVVLEPNQTNILLESFEFELV